MMAKDVNSFADKSGDSYILDLPCGIHRHLCESLDTDEGWKKLACSFGYPLSEIKQMHLEYQRPNGSPTDKLLWDLATKNITVCELYSKLKEVELYKDMHLLETSIITMGKTSLSDEKAVTVMDMKATRQNENVNLNSTQRCSQKGEEQKHYDDKIIPGRNSSKKQHCGEASVPQENADESLQNPLESMFISTPKEKELHVYKSLTRTCQSSLDVAVAMIGTHSITYKEILQITNDFSEESKIGEGVFGEVHIGTYLNTKCAIKRLFERFESNDSAEGPTSHLASELTALMKYRHENLVSLYGYAIDGEEVCLVYQYMTNGSLEDRLHCKNNSTPLSWKQRLCIMRGAACGLQYLHTLGTKPLIHGDIKSANILLDKHFEAKISDLSLAHQGENGTSSVALTHITKQEKRTKSYQCMAYLPPENKRGGKASIKADSYAFGVVLYEVATGEKAYDDKREGDGLMLVDYVAEQSERTWGDLQDKRAGGSDGEVFLQFLKLGAWCTKKKKERPDMVQVFKQLEELEMQINTGNFNIHINIGDEGKPQNVCTFFSGVGALVCTSNASSSISVPDTIGHQKIGGCDDIYSDRNSIITEGNECTENDQRIRNISGELKNESEIMNDKVTMQQNRDSFFTSYKLQMESGDIYEESKFDMYKENFEETPELDSGSLKTYDENPMVANEYPSK